MDVEEFGPLIVMIDPTGANYYDEVYSSVENRVRGVVYPQLGITGRAYANRQQDRIEPLTLTVVISASCYQAAFSASERPG